MEALESYALEFNFFSEPSPEKNKIKKALIKKILGIKKLEVYYKKNLEKNYYIYSFYQGERLLYTDNLSYNKIIENLNKVEKDDLLYSDNKDLEIYNNFHNGLKNLKSKNLEGLKVVKDKGLKIHEDIEDLYCSKNPDRIFKFLGLENKFLNFFTHRDIYEKGNLEKVDNKKLPHYRLIHSDKYKLLDILGNHSLNFNHEDINYYLLNDYLPFINHRELKKHLEKFYNDPKNIYHHSFTDDSEKAYNVLLGRDKSIVLEEPIGFNIYTKEKFFDSQLEEMRESYLKKLDNLDKNYIIPYNSLNNKDLINLEYKNDTLDNVKGEDKYHHGFYSNGIYESHLKINREELKTIDPINIEIEFLKDIDSFYTLLIICGYESIELNYFFVPEDKILLMENMIKKLWKKGLFLTHFGKANYINENKILESELVVPDWLYSDDMESFKKLTKKISSIN